MSGALDTVAPSHCGNLHNLEFALQPNRPQTQSSAAVSDTPAGFGKYPSEVSRYPTRVLLNTRRGFYVRYPPPVSRGTRQKEAKTNWVTRLAVTADDELTFRAMRQPHVHAQLDIRGYSSRRERARSLAGMRT